MNSKNILAKISKFLGVDCTHKSVRDDRFKFCPDCGKKVVVKQVCIKCMECGRLRKAVKPDYKNILPAKKFCTFCGSSKWTYEYYYDANIPEKLREISVKQVTEDKENPFIYNHADNYTDIWIEKPQNESGYYKSNVIKHKRV